MFWEIYNSLRALTLQLSKQFEIENFEQDLHWTMAYDSNQSQDMDNTFDYIEKEISQNLEHGATD